MFHIVLFKYNTDSKWTHFMTSVIKCSEFSLVCQFLINFAA